MEEEEGRGERVDAQMHIPVLLRVASVTEAAAEESHCRGGLGWPT